MKLTFDLQGYLAQQERKKKGYVERYDDPATVEVDNEIKERQQRSLERVTIDKVAISIPKRFINKENAHLLFDPTNIVAYKQSRAYYMIYFNAEFFSQDGDIFERRIQRYLLECFKLDIFNKDEVAQLIPPSDKTRDAWPYLQRYINIVEVEVAFDCSIEALEMPKEPTVMIHPFPTTWYSNDSYEYRRKDGSKKRKSKGTISIYRRDIALRNKNQVKYQRIKKEYRLEFRIHDQKHKALSWKTISSNKIGIFYNVIDYLISSGSRLLDPEIKVNESILINDNYALFIMLVNIQYKRYQMLYEFISSLLPSLGIYSK